MKVLDPDAGRVAAVARRIAVALALRELEGEKRNVGPFSDAARATLIDDLCGLSHALDAADVPDAALACAAADLDRGDSLAAGVAYAARLLLRGSGVDASSMPSRASQHGHITRYPDLQTAVEGVRASGVSVARAPRAALRLLSDAQPLPPADMPLRLVICVHAPDAMLLAETLCLPPFDLDRDELASTLTGVQGPPRGALASAIASMIGGSARDRAIAVLEVLDAVLESSASSEALGRSVHAARKASAALSPGSADGASAVLDACIIAADRVFDAASSDTKAGERARLVSDSFASAEPNGLGVVPYVGSLEVQATIGFQDSAAPVDLDRFAHAIGCDASAIQGLLEPGPKAIVAGSLTDNLARHALERAPAVPVRAVPPADPQAAVVSPGMTFSASRLNTYVKCPRRYFFEYLCEAIEDPGSLHATYGRVVHDALEMLHREIRSPARHEPSAILERLLRDLDAAFGAARADFASQLEYESSRWRARRMAEQYVRWLCAEAKRSPMEIAAVEVFERRRLGEHDFIGYIDRIDRPEGGGAITIYDYKTGRIDDDAAEYLEKVRSGDEAQLALYYAMRKAAGDEIKRIALVSIRDPRDEVWILALDLIASGEEPRPRIDREAGVVSVSCSPADLDASLEALLRRCDVLTKEGISHFAPGADPPCGFCEYAQACRERPLGGERVFAR